MSFIVLLHHINDDYIEWGYIGTIENIIKEENTTVSTASSAFSIKNIILSNNSNIKNTIEFIDFVIPDKYDRIEFGCNWIRNDKTIKCSTIGGMNVYTLYVYHEYMIYSDEHLIYKLDSIGYINRLVTFQDKFISVKINDTNIVFDIVEETEINRLQRNNYLFYTKIGQFGLYDSYYKTCRCIDRLREYFTKFVLLNTTNVEM